MDESCTSDIYMHGKAISDVVNPLFWYFGSKTRTSSKKILKHMQWLFC